MAGSVKDLIVRLLVDDSDLDKVDKSAQRFGTFKDGLNTASAGAAVALGGIITAGAVAMNDLARIEAIEAQTTSAIESSGGAAGVTTEQIGALSDRLEDLTATEGEAIQEGANLLLTFHNIRNAAGEGNDIFDQSTAALVDMARAMGTEPAAAAVQLGKALNDPIAGIASLSRVGVQFTDDQKALIESLVESGDVMGAQKVILGELNSQFGGSGESYAETMAGKQDLLTHKLGETAEQITVALLPAVTDFLDGALGFATWASENTELLGFLVAAVAVVAAGILTMNGVVTAFQAVQAIQTAAQWANNAAWLASPVTWIIAAIIVAIGLLVAAGIWLWQNWDGVTKWIGEAWTNLMTGFAIGGEQIVSFFSGIPDAIGGAFEFAGEGMLRIGHGIATAFAWLWNNTVGAISFEVPGWVPFIGGQSVDVPDIVVPALAAGGIATRATLALIGEAGPEAVVPLSQGARYGLGGAPGTVEVPVVIDGREIWRIVKRWDLREG